MSTIILERVSEHRGANHRMEVFLDGQSVAYLKNGEVVHLRTTAGQHTLQTDESNELAFEIAEDASLAFHIAYNRNYGTYETYAYPDVSDLIIIGGESLSHLLNEEKAFNIVPVPADSYMAKV